MTQEPSTFTKALAVIGMLALAAWVGHQLGWL